MSFKRKYGSENASGISLKRTAVGALLLLLIVVGLSACGSDSGSSSDSTATTESGGETGSTTEGGEVSGSNIGLVTLGNGNVYSDNSRKAMEEQAEKEGMTVESFDGAFSPDKQLAACQQISTAGQSKYQALVIVPITPAAGVPCAPLAEGAGIPMISVGNATGDSLDSVEPTVKGVTGQALIPLDVVVEGVVNLTVKACEDKDPCKIGWMRTTSTLSQADAVMDEKLQAAMTENPNMEIVAEADMELEVQAAEAMTNNFLQKAPDLNVMTSYTAQGAIGAAKAIEAAGKSHDNANGIRLIDQGCTMEFVTMLRKEEGFGCVPTLPLTEGEIGVKLAAAAIAGEPVESVNALEVAGLPSEFTVEAAEEIPDFKGEWNN